MCGSVWLEENVKVWLLRARAPGVEDGGAKELEARGVQLRGREGLDHSDPEPEGRRLCRPVGARDAARHARRRPRVEEGPRDLIRCT